MFVRINLWLCILWIIVALGLGEAALLEFVHCDAPHEVEFMGMAPATETICAGIGVHCNGGITWNDETDGATPLRIKRIFRDGGAQVLEFGDGVGIKVNDGTLVPPPKTELGGSGAHAIIELMLEAKGAEETHGTDYGGMPNEAKKAGALVWGGALASCNVQLTVQDCVQKQFKFLTLG